MINARIESAYNLKIKRKENIESILSLQKELKYRQVLLNSLIDDRSNIVLTMSNQSMLVKGKQLEIDKLSENFILKQLDETIKQVTTEILTINKSIQYLQERVEQFNKDIVSFS